MINRQAPSRSRAAAKGYGVPKTRSASLPESSSQEIRAAYNCPSRASQDVVKYDRRGGDLMKEKRIQQRLYLQVLIAISIGAALGYFFPETGAAMKPLGEGFIRLIKMVIAPIIFCTVVMGIAGMENMKAVGKTGGLALLYFEVLSTLALIIGLILVNVVQPGAGMNIDPATLDSRAVSAYTDSAKIENTGQFLINIIPESAVGAFAKGDILQTLLFSILFGFSLHGFGESGRRIFQLIEDLSALLFKMVGYIMKAAPIGAFGSMAFTIGRYGPASLLPLAKLMAAFYGTCIIFIFVVLGTIARLHGFSIWRLVNFFKEELFIVVGTSSSESVLPRVMEKLERLGAHRSVVGLVVPAGYSFNLDGTSIYLTMAAIFVAQATNSN